MKIKIINDSITKTACDILIVGLFEGINPLTVVAEEIDAALDGLIDQNLREQQGIAKHGVVTVLQGFRGIAASKLLLFGLGKRREFTAERLRAAAGAAIRAAVKLEARTIATVIPEGFEPELGGQALTEGMLLGCYRFDYYKTRPETKRIPEVLHLVEYDAERAALIKNGAQFAQITAKAVNLARDMVNHPGNFMTPAKMAWHATQIAGKLGLEVNILEREQLEQLGMQSFLAVAQGSNEPPKLIAMKYGGAPNDNRLLALVGKGITFDSGGISLKPGEGMQEMKDDMAGAAAVLAAIQAIAELKLPVNILAIAACTENLPSGHACKPGDVIYSMSGKTIEIISTDAEGRLVLADAIAYARKLGATQIVDLATLTGACVVALGHVTSAIMGNDHILKERILDASLATGEKMWELPLFEEYKEQIKSDIADMKNTGGRPAGAITAGLFIAEFAEKTPWVHIDIAGTVSSEKETGYNVKGATGVGVRTLIQLASGWRKS